jgi:hypothetical protein
MPVRLVSGTETAIELIVDSLERLRPRVPWHGWAYGGLSRLRPPWRRESGVNHLV